MTRKQIALDLAAFLDSPQALALAEPAREDVRKIAGTFLRLCYEDVGKKPRLLDAQDVHGILGHLMPASFKRKDPLAQQVGPVLRAYVSHLEESEVVPNAFEVRNELEGTLDEFLESVRTGQNVHHHAPKQERVVHRAAKLGRNDPCFCGSGKKFKKCHGKAG